MPTSFPVALDVYNNPGPSTFEDAPGYELDLVISNLNDAVRAIETKLGIGASVGSAGSVLRATGAGITQYGQIGSTDLAAGSVTNAAILANTIVGYDKIAAGTVQNSQIGIGQISGDRLQNATLTATQLAAGAAQVHAQTTDGAAATLSSAGTWATVPGMAPTITTIGGDVLAFGAISLYNSVSASALFLGARESAGADVAVGQHQPSGVNVNTLISFVYLLTGLAAGTHTFNMRWQTTAGTLNRAGSSSFGVVELRR
jgi:hypothetical protein